MIQFSNRPINSAVKVTAKISTTTLPSDFTILKDGAADSTVVTFSNLNVAGLANFTFTPTASGVYTLYGDTQVIATVEVVARTPVSYLQNIEDESLGSWTWNKVTGSLALVKQDGTSLANFQVVDTVTSGSKERV